MSKKLKHSIKTNRQKKKDSERRVERKYAHITRCHDIWIDFKSAQEERDKLEKTSLIIEEEPIDDKAPPLASAVVGKSWVFFVKYVFMARAFAYRDAWQHTYTYIAFQRYSENLLGGNQFITPSFTSYVNRFDRTQGFIGSLPQWQLLLTINNFPPLVIQFWRGLREIIVDIGLTIRLTAMLLRFPSFRRIKRFSSRRKLTKRQFALPRILRKVGGPAGYLQLIGVVVLPIMGVVLAWQTGYSISCLPLESLVKHHNSQAGQKVSPIQLLIQSSWQDTAFNYERALEIAIVNPMLINEHLPPIDWKTIVPSSHVPLFKFKKTNPYKTLYEYISKQALDNQSQSLLVVLDKRSLRTNLDSPDSLDESPPQTPSDAEMEDATSGAEMEDATSGAEMEVLVDVKLEKMVQIPSFIKIEHAKAMMKVLGLEIMTEPTDSDCRVIDGLRIPHLQMNDWAQFVLSPQLDHNGESQGRIALDDLTKSLHPTYVRSYQFVTLEMVWKQTGDAIRPVVVMRWQQTVNLAIQFVKTIENRLEKWLTPSRMTFFRQHFTHYAMSAWSLFQPPLLVLKRYLTVILKTWDDMTLELDQPKESLWSIIITWPFPIGFKDVAQDQLNTEWIPISRIVSGYPDLEFHDEWSDDEYMLETHEVKIVDDNEEDDNEDWFVGLTVAELDEPSVDILNFLINVNGYERETSYTKLKHANPASDLQAGANHDLSFLRYLSPITGEYIKKPLFDYITNSQQMLLRLKAYCKVYINKRTIPLLLYLDNVLINKVPIWRKLHHIHANYVRSLPVVEQELAFKLSPLIPIPMLEPKLAQFVEGLNCYFYGSKGGAVVVGYVFTVLLSATALTWLGIAYLNLWWLSERMIDFSYPSRYQQVRLIIEKHVFAKHLGHKWKLPDIPEDNTSILDLYITLYTWYMNKRVVKKWLTECERSNDVIDAHRSIIHKSLITADALLQSPVNLKQKVGQSNYKDRFRWDTTLTSLHARLKTYYGGTVRALAPLGIVSKKYLRHEALYRALYYHYHPIVPHVSELADQAILEEHGIQHSIDYRHVGLFQYTSLPIPCQSYMVIGRPGAGKFYLAKSMAANLNLPLVSIGPRTVLKHPRELQLEFNLHNDTGMRPLLDHFNDILPEKYMVNLFQLRIAFLLAERLAPCVVWIPNLQRFTQDAFENSVTYGVPRVITSLILDLIAKNRDYGDRNILLVASCDNTRYLDPVYLGPKRFHELIHLDLPTVSHLEERMLGLLGIYGMTLSHDFNFTIVRNAIAGYCMREISGLVERVYRMCSLIGSYEVSENLIAEAIDRRSTLSDCGDFAHVNFKNSMEFVSYKLGKALVNTRNFPQPLFHANRKYLIRSAYRLSKWTIEIPYTDSCAKAYIMTPHFHAALAGLAARDAWLILSSGRVEPEVDPIYYQGYHDDVTIAIQLFRAYFSEFTTLTLRNQLADHNEESQHFAPVLQWSTGHVLNVLGQLKLSKSEYLDIDYLIDWDIDKIRLKNIVSYYDVSQTSDSLAGFLIPMYRNFFFEMDSHLSRMPSMYSVSRYGKEEQLSRMYRHRLTDEEYWSDVPITLYDEYHSFERYDFSILLEHNLEQFEFFKRRSARLGWSKHFDKINLISEQPPNLHPVLDTEYRRIWNPKPIFPVHLEFQRRKLKADRLNMTVLYNVYVERPDDPLAIYEVRRKPFWYRDEAQERIEDRIEDILMAAKGESEEQKKIRNRLKREQRENDSYDLFRLIVPIYLDFMRHKFLKKTSEGVTLEDLRTYDYFIGDMPFESLGRYSTVFNDKVYERTKLIPLEILVYQTMFNTYNQLCVCFLKHSNTFLSMLRTLIDDGILWPEQMTHFGRPNDLENFQAQKTPERVYQNFIRTKGVPQHLGRIYMDCVNTIIGELNG